MPAENASPPRVLRALAACWLASAAGCIPVPPGQGPREPWPAQVIPGGVFPGLDPGGKELSSLHFQVRAYGSDKVQLAADLAESLYSRIMTDTGLYSFKPQGLYSVVVYRDREEFLRKTGQPEWSGGATVGNAIYGYESPALGPVLAHEMTHLVFHEYLPRAGPELRWLNEGLAVYEERSGAGAAGSAAPQDFDARRALRDNPLPFDQMVALVPATERERAVSLWYLQAGDVVRFMIERGGRNGFGQFLAALQRGEGADAAVRQGFPGVWGGLGDLEAAWRRSL